MPYIFEIKFLIILIMSHFSIAEKTQTREFRYCISISQKGVNRTLILRNCFLIIIFINKKTKKV